VACLCALSLQFLAQAAHWPQWRGPSFNGTSTETNLPTRWSKSDGLAWTTLMPGRSAATPVVWEGSVFVPSADEAKKLWLLCLDQRDGSLLWQRQAGTGDRTIGKNNMASCSPVTDGKRVFALFGTSDFVAYDFAGKVVWQRQLKEEFGGFAVQFLYGASPLLFEGRLYLALLQRNPPTYGHATDGKPDRKSYLVCLDPDTGKTLWSQDRPTTAPEEAMEAYTTPVPWFSGNDLQLIVAGADCVTAHDPKTGAETWRFAGLNRKRNPGGRIVPSPVAAAELVFACGPKREVLVALHANRKGLTDDSQVAWRSTEFVPDVCTPLLYQGKLFVLDGDRQTMTCFNPATGEKHWQGKLGVREIFYASPIGADGKIYCLSEEGTAVVLAAGDKFEVLHTVAMGEGPCGASIVPVNGRLLIRTSKNLFCVSGQSD
jgi:outer membrane protein assembly factor BamB